MKAEIQQEINKAIKLIDQCDEDIKKHEEDINNIKIKLEVAKRLKKIQEGLVRFYNDTYGDKTIPQN